MAGYQPPCRRHDPPPRVTPATHGQHAANASGPSWKPGLGRDLAVGDDIARAEGQKHGLDRRFEVIG